MTTQESNDRLIDAEDTIEFLEERVLFIFKTLYDIVDRTATTDRQIEELNNRIKELETETFNKCVH